MTWGFASEEATKSAEPYNEQYLFMSSMQSRSSSTIILQRHSSCLGFILSL